MIYGPPPQFKRITIEEVETEKIITYRWYHGTYLMHLWDGIIAFGYVFVIFKGWNPSAFWFGVISVAIALIVGGLSFYVALTGIFNTTQIFIRDQKLTIKSSPIPWFRDRPHEITNIVKVYNTERNARWRLEPFRIYPLRAMAKDGSVKIILGHLLD